MTSIMRAVRSVSCLDITSKWGWRSSTSFLIFVERRRHTSLLVFLILLEVAFSPLFVPKSELKPESKEKNGTCGLGISLTRQSWSSFSFCLGYLANIPEFSVGGWMWEEEHKGVMKKVMNESYSVHSQEI